MKPSIGRIVLFKDDRGTYPAIITNVHGELLSLTVFGEGWIDNNVACFNQAESADTAVNHNWYWPPRV